MKKIAPIYSMLMLSIGFTLFLLFVRIVITQKLTFIFFGWNLFLAIVPIVISQQLKYQSKLNFKSFVLLALWLLFFPNAPYIITDLFHFTERPPVPKWYDLILIISAVWNGLVIGVISLMQVEHFLKKHITARWVKVIIFMSSLLCGYGVFIGRYVRLNSWDIVTNPTTVLYACVQYFFKPWNHVFAWVFIVLFASLFVIVYFTLKQIALLKLEANES